MCGQLAQAWGNERFGAVRPAEEVCLAAEQHEIGMVEWDRAPTLDPTTGLPTTVNRLDLSTHLPLRLQGPERLLDQSPYAALLASLHHTSFYSMPPVLGLARRPGRQIRGYLRQSASLQARLREELGVPAAEIERNWRLVRAWDGLSHLLMFERAPQAIPNVPAAPEKMIDVHVSRRDGTHSLDPWPFSAGRVSVGVEARLLEDRFSEPDRLLRALAEAPQIELSYEMVPQ
jgi:hypothetical protein